MSITGMPTFYDMPYTEDDGSLTSESLFYNDQLFQVINDIVNQLNDGLQISQKTTDQITAFGADVDVPDGTIWFNTDSAKLQVKTASGTIETITST